MQQEISINKSNQLPLAIYNLIFNGVKVIYKGNQIKKYTVSMRSGGTISKVKVGEFLYLEQNPYKDSKYGRLARQGHKIIWIIYEPVNKSKQHPFRPGAYIAKVVDEEIERL